MKKLREAYLQYTDPTVPPEERPTQVMLAHELGLPQTTISYWFDKFTQEEGGSPEFTSEESAEEMAQPGKKRKGHKTLGEKTALRKTASAAIAHISDRSIKGAEQAIIIGDIIMNDYSDLIKIAAAKGMSIDDFLQEVFTFYERKAQLTQYVTGLEAHLAELQELTDPNWRFKRKSSLLYRFARYLLAARVYGVKVNTKKAVRALQIELEKIDK